MCSHTCPGKLAFHNGPEELDSSSDRQVKLNKQIDDKVPHSERLVKRSTNILIINC